MKRLAMVSVLAACSGGGSGSVSLAYLDSGTPVPGVTVFFSNADGSLAGSAITDASGIAAQDVESGGYVSAVVPGSGDVPADLITLAGVEPGEQLKVDLGSPTQDIALTAPAYAGASEYEVSVLCRGLSGGGFLEAGDDGSAITGTIQAPNCTSGDILISAQDDAGAVTATLWQPGVAFAGSAATIPSTATYQPTGAAPYSYVATPTTFDVMIELAFSTANGYGQVATQGSTPTNGSGSFTLAMPALADATYIVESTAVGSAAGDATGNAGTSDVVIDWGGSDGGAAVDFTSGMLAGISPPQFDVNAMTVLWTAGSGVTPDAAYAELDVTGDPNVASWIIVGPYTAGTLQLPTLPGYTLSGSDAVSVDGLDELQSADGYGALLPTLFTLSSFGAPGTTGHLRLFSYFNG